MSRNHIFKVTVAASIILSRWGDVWCQEAGTAKEQAGKGESVGLHLSRVSTGSVHSATVDHSLDCADTQTVIAAIPIKNCLEVLQTYGGPLASGIRQAIEGYSILQNPTAPSNDLRYYVGGSFTAEAIGGDGGFATLTSSGAPAGATSIRVSNASAIVNGTH